MQRIRLGFALLAILLLVPLALLLNRTLSGLDRERDQRHQSVASRVFDEAERTLTEFLDEEESREPEQYSAQRSPGRPSPLAGPASRSFVIGHFQIDEAGTMTSPRAGHAALLRQRLEGLVAAQRKGERATRDEKLAMRDGVAGNAELSAVAEQRGIQRPGSTKAVQKLDFLDRSEPVEHDDASLDAAEEESDERYSSFRILEQLNLGRRGRAKKSLATSLPSRAESAEIAASPRLAITAQGPRSAMGAVADPRDQHLTDTEAIAPQQEGTPDGSPPPQPQSELQKQLTRASTPRMTSLAIDDHHLILYRTTVVAGRGVYQQGLLINLERFADWIEERVVGESGLARFIEFDLVPKRELGALSNGATRRFIYDHRFGEPFEELGARLSLASLPDTGGNTNIYTMALLLIAASTLGLWAMYRRVAVAVHFAERRSNFAAAVSHELKTPLTAIRMYAEMLRDGMVPDDTKRREYYQTITSEAERLTRLINNVLEFSHLEKRPRKLETQSAQVEGFLREVTRILEPHAHSRGFAINLTIEPDLPRVRFEADALQQILFNLIDNALKYAETASRKEVHIEANRFVGGVQIVVRDFGAGVSEEHLRHLFEPFYRGEDELTRRTKGTGIGLALVKGLADQMNGEVCARSAPGGGFEVELRLRS